MLSRTRALFVASAALVLFACASTTPRVEHDADVARDPAVEDEPLASAPVVEQERAAPLSIPKLEGIEALIQAGDVDGARAALTEWAAGGLGDYLRGLDDVSGIEAAVAVDVVAKQLVLLRVQLFAREHVHAVRERLLPADHRDLLAVKQGVAVTRFALGDLVGARALFEHVHAAWEQTLPADDPNLLNLKHNLATTRGALGDIKGAHALFESLHDARDRLLPADHPVLLSAKVSLALTRKELGDLEGALALEEHVHTARERLLSADHPDSLAAKQNLAVTRKSLGDIAGALALEEYVHDARERHLIADHPDLLAAKQNLAVTRKSLGDLAGALALEEHVHAACERLLSSSHPDLLLAKQNLAVTRKTLGDLRGALALEEYVHDARERLLNADHRELLAAKQNLAVTRKMLGDLRGALALEEYVHDVRERLLIADHPELLAAKQNLAGTRRKLGDLEGALTLFEHVHSALERLLPADHHNLLAAKQGLAETRHTLGDLESALALFEHVHSARERLLPADHPALLAAMQGLAETRHTLGDHADALALFEHVHSARERLLSADHPDLLAAKEGLAGARLALGDIDGARALIEYVHASYDHSLAPDHLQLLSTKLNLAGVLMALGDLDGALALQEHVHSAYEKLLPPNHPHLLTAKMNLAATRSRIGDVHTSHALAVNALTDCERVLPADHPQTLLARQNLAWACGAIGDLNGALTLLESVHAASERRLPENHPDLLLVKQNLTVARLALGDLGGVSTMAHSLLAGQSAVAGSFATHAPRLARSAALRELNRLAWCAGFGERVDSRSGAALNAEIFWTLESLRLVSTTSNTVTRAAIGVPELASTLSELVRVRRKLAEMSLAGPSASTTMDAWESELRVLAEERDALERAVRVEVEARGFEFTLPSAASVAAALPKDAALLGFWRYWRIGGPLHGTKSAVWTDALLAFVLTPDQTVRRIELGPAAAIDAAIEHWRDALGAPLDARSPSIGKRVAAPDEIAMAGAELRALVLDPILAAVPDVKELRCVLDDTLFLVPLDALPLDGGVVGERYTIRVGTTVQQFDAPDRESAVAPSLVVVGGVDYTANGEEVPEREVFVATPPTDAGTRSVVGASFTPLEGAAVEAQRVAELFEQRIATEAVELSGASATKAALVEHVENARYLHVATHGWFAPPTVVSMLDGVGASASDELRLSVDRAQDTIVGFLPETLCGLALAGANNGPEGILTAEELATLDLSNCELAVLSACETNVGIRRAGQGIQSLQTALHAAGARTAITSLWRVDDAATRRLFELFYTKLWSDKLGPADALWQAKMALRTENHPTRDWAGWVLTGDPD